jgi:hypothetical protein
VENRIFLFSIRLLRAANPVRGEPGNKPKTYNNFGDPTEPVDSWAVVPELSPGLCLDTLIL